jgi:ABC-type polysaccharide/polyol phosphate export permease
MSLKKFWNLSFYLSKAQFRIRNEGSFLGILWYLLNPLLFFALLFFIFSNNLGADIKYYPLYLFLGLIMFNFFQASTNDAIYIIRGNKHLLKSINFPRASFIAGSVLKFLYSNLFEFLVFIIFVLILGASITNILFYPLILIFFIIFIFGISLFIGSISVYFLDFGNIWSFFCSLLWFATPIFYTLDTHPLLSKLSYANPLYYFITATRDLVIYNEFPPLIIIIGIIILSILSLLFGLIVFNKLKDRFTEVM